MNGETLLAEAIEMKDEIVENRRAIHRAPEVGAHLPQTVQFVEEKLRLLGYEPRELGGGVVVKYNANQRYTTDAVSGAVFQAVCQAAGVPTQRYSNRADLPGGSTLGNISTAHLSVPTVDIGLPQLAMHSVCETAGAADTDYLVKAIASYYACSFQQEADGGITL